MNRRKIPAKRVDKELVNEGFSPQGGKDTHVVQVPQSD